MLCLPPGNLNFEYSRVQGPIGDVDDLCTLMGVDRLLFGPNLPNNSAESAKLRIEYAEVSEGVKQARFGGNAERSLCTRGWFKYFDKEIAQ